MGNQNSMQESPKMVELLAVPIDENGFRYVVPIPITQQRPNDCGSPDGSDNTNSYPQPKRPNQSNLDSDDWWYHCMIFDRL